MNIRVKNTHKLLRLLVFREPSDPSPFNSWRMIEIDSEKRKEIQQTLEVALHEFYEECHFNYTQPNFWEYAFFLLQQLTGIGNIYDHELPNLLTLETEAEAEMMNVYWILLNVCVNVRTDIEATMDDLLEMHDWMKDDNFNIKIEKLEPGKIVNDNNGQSTFNVESESLQNKRITYNMSKADVAALFHMFKDLKIISASKQEIINHIEQHINYTKKGEPVKFENVGIELSRLTNENILNLNQTELKNARDQINALKEVLDKTKDYRPEKPEPKSRK